LVRDIYVKGTSGAFKSHYVVWKYIHSQKE